MSQSPALVTVKLPATAVFMKICFCRVACIQMVLIRPGLCLAAALAKVACAPHPTACQSQRLCKSATPFRADNAIFVSDNVTGVLACTFADMSFCLKCTQILPGVVAAPLVLRVQTEQAANSDRQVIKAVSRFAKCIVLYMNCANIGTKLLTSKSLCRGTLWSGRRKKAMS